MHRRHLRRLYEGGMSQALDPAAPPADPAAPATPPATSPAGEPVPPEVPVSNPSPATPPAVPPVQQGTGQEPDTFPRSYVETLRREAAANRVAHNEVKEELDKLKREQMTESQKVQADLKAATEVRIPALENENRQLQVKLAASQLGIVDPEVAAAFVDWDAIKRGATVEQELTALIERKPYLKGAAPTAGSAVLPPPVPVTPQTPPPPQNPANPGTPPVTPAARRYTKSELTNMTPQAMAPILEDVKQALAEGRVDMTR